MKQYDFLIVGGGIFGICTSLVLLGRGYKVGLINPDQIPHPLAASTDISKVIRMEYGSDTEYMEMAIESMEQWRIWNDEFSDPFFHETGYLLLSKMNFESGQQPYELASYQQLIKRGFTPERLDAGQISKRFPAFADGIYQDGFYHRVGGYAESGRAVQCLCDRAKKKGLEVHEGQTAATILTRKKITYGVKTREGSVFNAGHIVIAAGNSTPYLLPELKPFMKITGHPVFHLKPSKPDMFDVPDFSVFAADIAHTGWYGFPLHPKNEVVKIAKHSAGLELHPERDERVVCPEDVLELRSFLKSSLPSIANDPIVYTRRCCYTDTLDGHFWIDRHPEIKGLSVGSGGSGHGFKMGPVVGEMLANVAEGRDHKWSDRYSWRTLGQGTSQNEEARFLLNRSL